MGGTVSASTLKTNGSGPERDWRVALANFSYSSMQWAIWIEGKKKSARNQRRNENGYQPTTKKGSFKDFLIRNSNFDFSLELLGNFTAAS